MGSARGYTGLERLARLASVVAFVLLCAASARGQSAPIALVQHTSRDAGTTSSSSLAFGSNNTAGNWIAVVIRAGRVSQVITVTDTRGNIYRKALQFNETGDGTTLAIFYAENVVAGANTVTVADTLSGGTLRFAILEYAGVASANSLDMTATAQGTSAAPGTGTVTTTANGDLVLGFLSTANPRTVVAGSGYAIQESVPASPNAKLVVEDRVLSAAGAVTANGTLNGSDFWGAGLAAFRAAAGGTPPPVITPAITSVSPASGPVGASVTITGTSFGTAGTVRFNGTSAVPTSWSATSVVAPVPAGATTGPVVVTVNGVASNGVTFGVTPSGGGTQVPVLRQHTSRDAGTTTSSSLAFGASNTAGNWIAVVIRAGGMSQVFTVTDTRGNTYRRALQFTETLDGTSLAIFYAENVAAGANTVTVSDTISGNTLRFAILEYAGVATANSLEVTATSQGTGTAPSTGPVTTTANGDLVIGLLSTANSRAVVAGSGYAIQESVPAAPNAKLVVEDRVLSTAGTVTANGMLNASDQWGAGLAVFRASAGGSNPAPAITSVSPTSGSAGTQVTITGTNFGTAGTVRFNGTLAQPASWSATSVVVPIPAGATTGPVVLTVNGAASNDVLFSIADTQAPTAPGSLTVTPVGTSQVDLRWSPSTDDVGVVQYRVERCQGALCTDFAEIARVSAATAAPAAPLTASANPNYFEDANGTPIILNGSHTWNNLQDWGTNGAPQTLGLRRLREFPGRARTQLHAALAHRAAEVLRPADHGQRRTPTSP